MVKIPLTIQDSTLWYADLQAWDPESGSYEKGGRCFIDNNNPRTVIFNKWASSSVTNFWFDEDLANCDNKSEEEIQEDGNTYAGYDCTQKLCIGSY